MNNTPSVSIVVGFFNAATFIAETVESVLNQTLDDWELLLVDDGSQDASCEIAKRFSRQYPDKIRYLEHDGHRNLGVCASRNLGLRHTVGQFIAILDSDDVWQAAKLEQQTAILKTNPAAGMVFGASSYWQSWTGAADDAQRDYVPRLGVEPDTLHLPPTLLVRCHPLGRATAPCPSDLLLRREVLETIGGFEEDFIGIYQLYEDQAFLAKVYLTTPVFASNSTWTRYRLHPDSCCYRVASSGDEPAARSYYLNWLREYLRTNSVDDARVYKALNRALLLQRSPTLSWFAGVPDTVTRLGKKLLRNVRPRPGSS